MKVIDLISKIFLFPLSFVNNLLNKKNKNYLYYNYIIHLTYIIFGSNHPKRLDEFKKILLFRKGFFYKNFFQKKKIIFIGDSHVEYYSRVNRENFIDIKGIWFGKAALFYLFYFKKNFNELLNTTGKFLSKKTTNTIIFSLGSTDINTFFYQTLINKSFKNEKELFNNFEKISFDILKLAKLYFSKRKSKLIVMGVLQRGYLDNGFKSKNLNSLNRLLQKREFSTLGSLRQRKRWVKLTNKRLMKNCEKLKLNFFDTNSLILKSNTSKTVKKDIINDGIHLTSDFHLNKLIDEIISRYVK